MEKQTVEMKELVSKAHRQLEIKKDTYLFREGEQAEEVYYIQSGKIQISKIAADGQELALRICSKGDIVGELTLFAEQAKYLLNAKVLEDGIVSCIQRDVLEKSLLENNKLALEFMKWMSDHFRKTQTKFRDLVLHGKKGALYSTLIRMCNSYGVMKENGILIDLQLTNQELANFCGTSREVVNRLLKDLREQGIISIKRGKITVHNLTYLRNEIDCEDCPPEICSID
ncbi:CRP/FNR family transcriptional regulator [Anoxybacillus voinovskiensis]|uniref:CRP/FNR family transcriptional regulator n=2 Tax=Anoxybacteroides voinovskiense TaxID=230470 RepID=A0A840DRV9_9BACL|nr:Crp/Fnr family transcriptional regulator [Anoxybacillus voinovskiensis]MBB4074403.1 CRP/FNR family transcriptional regulator [Anoxybacillus voinovskiensis]GGJ70149.1 Crp/Fnr family transcriptional regulator [Anoxybacillus voinovskiensis]